MDNPLECRKSIRLKIRAFLTHIKSDLTGQKSNGTSVDISSGGVLFTSSFKYTLGDTINLEVKLPGWKEFKPKIDGSDNSNDEEVIVVSAEVLRVQEMDTDLYFIGTRFIWSDNEHQKALEKYINKRAQGRSSFFT